MTHSQRCKNLMKKLNQLCNNALKFKHLIQLKIIFTDKSRTNCYELQISCAYTFLNLFKFISVTNTSFLTCISFF